jgi:cytochrome c
MADSASGKVNMKRYVTAGVFMLGLLPVAMADMKLASDKNCLSCHDVSAKRMGPSYKDIAARYAAQKDALDKLTTKVLKGGSGAWGNMPMPSNPQVSEAEARKLVAWVLAQK